MEPSGHVCSPWPFFLLSLYSPSYFAPFAHVYTPCPCNSKNPSCQTMTFDTVKMHEEALSKDLHFVVDILALISSPVLVCQSSKSGALTIHPVTLVPSTIRPSHQPVTCLHRVDVFALVSVEKTKATHSENVQARGRRYCSSK